MTGGKGTRSNSQPKPDPAFVAAIKEVMKSNEFIQTLSTLIQEAVSTKFDEYIEKQNKIINALLNENSLLKGEIQSLSGRIDRTEQYSKKFNIRVFGIPEVERENTEKITLDLFNKKMDLDISMDAIGSCRRVGTRKNNGKPRQILVTFDSYCTRKLVYSNKKKLKSTGIAIKEDLTATRLSIYKKACDFFNFKDVWSRNGTIFISVMNKTYKFNEKQELDKFIADSKS